ncbi:Acetyltransferase (GNAT) domain-containing protein [Chitinophaga costaii]|uniref:Acetyltransferase (GNAT) domain-containing protein n=1 Tax=Chitinophaga costaii TaxID=1335309 RepID=A0A1C4AKV2_9BACT|nr:GNAT family N-acetyltransferase [Chitinophaga costaii]PUZ26644.1 N-acetyltransferase [Chitinophaga costaii]SCB95137.1 Acetyltransferase (GNAT) domain-containing protein [Chitinophaga costaii]
MQTSRLHLIFCKLEYFEALLHGPQHLAELLAIKIPEHWPPYTELVLVAYDKLRNHPELDGWFFYLVVHKTDRTLIGTGGFKSLPDANGVVEVGYEVQEDYREQGYGTELLEALIDYAFAHAAVTEVIAHTLEEYNATVKVLQKCGLTFAGSMPTDDEPLWRWSLRREVYERKVITQTEKILS